VRSSSPVNDRVIPERPAFADIILLFIFPSGFEALRDCSTGSLPLPDFCVFFIFIVISFHLFFPAGYTQPSLFCIMEIENRKLLPALAAPYCRDLRVFPHRGTGPGRRRCVGLYPGGSQRNCALVTERGKASLGNSRLPVCPLRIQDPHGFVEVPDLFVMDSVGCKNSSHPPGAVLQCGLLPYLHVCPATI
jgi:hypothetical protein